MNVPNLRFPEFKDEWNKINYSEVFKEFQYGMNASATEYDGENKYIRITDIDEKTSLFDNLNLTSPNDVLEDKYLVKENDILFARTGASTGKTYIYDKSDGKLYFAGFLIRGNVKETFNSNFIFYTTKTEKYNKWVKLMSARSGQPGINSKEYSSYTTLLPTREEQNKISSLLNLVDKKIQTQMKIIDKYESLIKGIREKLLLGYDMVELSKLIKIVSRKNKSDLISSVYSVNNKLGFISQNEQFEDREIASDDKKNYKIVKTGEFAFNPARINVGSIAMSNNLNDVIVSPMYTCFKTKSYLNNKYLNQLVKTHYFKYEVVKRLEGSVRLCLSTESLLNIKIPLPPVEIQTEVITHIDILNKYLFNNISLLNECNNLKSFLLLNLFK